MKLNQQPMPFNVNACNAEHHDGSRIIISCRWHGYEKCIYTSLDEILEYGPDLIDFVDGLESGFFVNAFQSSKRQAGTSGWSVSKNDTTIIVYAGISLSRFAFPMGVAKYLDPAPDGTCCAPVSHQPRSHRSRHDDRRSTDVHRRLPPGCPGN